jgi:putative oxidoreductase
MDEALLAGRILFCILFLFSGIGHFQRHRMMVEYTRQARVPLAEFAVPASGVMIVLGGLGVLLGVWGDLASLLLVAFLLPVAFTMHRFWGVDAQTQMMQMPHFLKNLSLAGASLVFFYLFREGGDDLPYTLTGPLF